MRYRLVLARSAEKDMRRLSAIAKARVAARIRALPDAPRAAARKLESGPLYRIRVGDYRVLYEIDDKDKVVTVIYIRHRREAYR